jgi:membrane protein YqaA with SNARE-associated domain
MGSIVASLVGWLLGKLFGKGKERRLEQKYAETRKENLELKAQNAGLRVTKQVKDEERKFKEDWEVADDKKRYEILKRDFNDPD